MEELIRQFDQRGVRYLVIGGQAARLEGVPRFSKEAADRPEDQMDIEFLRAKREAGRL